MTKDKFLAAMVDTLVPGGVLANGIVAPAASSIGITWDALEERHGRVLAAIATQAGGEEDFCLGTDEFRAAGFRGAGDSGAHPLLREPQRPCRLRLAIAPAAALGP